MRRLIASHTARRWWPFAGLVSVAVLLLAGPVRAAPGGRAPGRAAPAAPAAAAEGGAPFQYKLGSEAIPGYLVRRKGDSDRPGIVLVHDWWGLNDQTRSAANRIAGLGYTVLAPDLYRGKLPSDLGWARDYSRDLDRGWAMKALRGAVRALRSLPGGSRRAVGMIGFDLGGKLTLSAALKGLPIQTAISVYGDTRGDEEAVGKLGVPFLGIYAHDDRATPPEQVTAFKELLERLKRPAKIITLSDVGRFFLNEERPGYDPEAASSAWHYVQEFLTAHLDEAQYVPRREGRGFRDGELEQDLRQKKRHH